MSKITIEFNIPEEQEEADITLAAQKMYSVIWDLRNNMRHQLKYAEQHPEYNPGVEWLQNLLYQLLEDENLLNKF